MCEVGTIIGENNENISGHFVSRNNGNASLEGIQW